MQDRPTQGEALPTDANDTGLSAPAEAPKVSFPLRTRGGASKQIDILCGPYEMLGISTDMLVVSAFRNDYYPLPGTMVGMLSTNYGVSVQELSQDPSIDLKDLGVWVSREVAGDVPFRRLACVEIVGNADTPAEITENLFFSIKRCAGRGIDVRTIAMSLIGTGNQAIESSHIAAPLLTECVNALETIDRLERIVFFERDPQKYALLVDSVRKVLPAITDKSVFISYSHRDRVIADIVSEVFEENGIKTWIDHKKMRNPNYAAEIIEAMRDSYAYLILISKSSLASADVYRELRNAALLQDKGSLEIYQMLLEAVGPDEYPSEFSYYLTGLDWCDISSEPIRAKAEAFCHKLRRIEPRAPGEVTAP